MTEEHGCAECGADGGHALYCVACAEKYVSKGTRMTREEYNKLFHKEQLNLVAFKRLMDCDEEVLRLVNKAIEQEREACAKIAENKMLDDKNENIKKGYFYAQQSIAQDIRTRKNK